ncbi:MAG: hypothetical protein J5620_00060 [Alphaproteobacteria bacterium]|nr:hypothetical protein [Alphaproteobacteria bacterium]
MKKITFVALMVVLPMVAFGAVAKKQSAIQNGTNVRGRVAATGIYSQECYDAYYGCMDQFCISDNVNGGSCLCSNDNAKYEEELKEINEMLAEAARVRDVEVEKIKLGSNVDIVFGGGRTYDEKGNVVYNVTKSNGATDKATKKQELLKLFDTNFNFDDGADDDDDDIMNKTGAALFSVADETCQKQVGASCAKDMKFLKQTYQRQIESDCRGFANSIAQQRAAAQTAMNDAEKEVRTALQESFDSANKYNQGECMVELKNCMVGPDACGTDWVDCVSTVAAENMQNKSLQSSVAGTKVKTTVKYNISASVMERLESKRTICERVLDQCMAVRDNVWDAFLREVAPTLKLAELRAESNMRTSCLTDITQCLHKACKDDIAGKGVATMDSCLSRPDMARSFCKNQIEPCERMAGDDLWSYVKDKLLAMRVDACTAEVKECFTDEMRCGADFMNCIGMDYEFIHEMCPLDKLVACKGYKKDGKDFSMEDVDSIIMGLYLNIDNRALENCQKLVENKMTEICGSTTDCNRFASDDTIGTGSLRSVKDGNIYRITGMISFGALPVATSGDNVGKVDITEYMNNVRTNAENQNVPRRDEIVTSIESELNNVANNINRVIDMIASDEQIKYCVTGRSLEQIKPGERTQTVARFPHMLDQVKMQIAVAALRQAQNNYQAKYNELLTKATKDYSADVAQYLCQMLPVTGGAPVDGKGLENEETRLNPPYAISYEVGAGLSNTLLARGGRDSSATTGTVTGENSTAKQNTFVATTGAILSGGVSLGVDAMSGAGGKSTYEIPGGTREMWSTFNRETRICRLCSSTVTRDCAHIYKRGFLGIGHKDETNCTESEPIEKCDDIEM